MITDSNDPFALDRFVQAQSHAFETALAEIISGCKRSHWMWYIFPQYAGLGYSALSQRYAISSAAEARAYLDHPILGPRLLRCCEALLAIDNRSAYEIFDSPDDMKLKSCATLFASITPEGSVFEQLLNRYFQGNRDQKTLDLLGISS
ncbi:DUF1810 domain-containing protein [Nitrosomonas sp.]|uniref:DUF1810 domain-containing protein n=1 Tax=Nitrosomonas sp. TaxID=42353 RepID=UPI001D507F73|nr:DUF1810 domain-containing protein [Nitrosomonas sp.]MBX3617437.1 DUF1810 domain-containing protein [Nitrosomonas sp.]